VFGEVEKKELLDRAWVWQIWEDAKKIHQGYFIKL
jgi:hypothetical protein